MGAPFIRLVVLNFNGGELVERCVDHLEQLDWPADRLDLVVVDNASSDGSAESVGARERVRLVRSAANDGFPANNLGMGELDGVDYIGLVNNDAFVEPDYLHPLVAALDADPGLGAACPKILLAPRFADVAIRCEPWHSPGDPRWLGVRVSGIEVGGSAHWSDVVPLDGMHGVESAEDPETAFRWTSGDARLGIPASSEASSVRLRLAAPRRTRVELDGGAGPDVVEVDETPTWFEVPLARDRYDVIQNAGSRLVQGGYGGDRGFLTRDDGQLDDAQEVFAWCGAGVLMRPAYLDEVGLFDPRFFMYYEDTDLAWRGRLAGWRYRYVPTSVVRHVHAATSGEGSPMFNHFVQRNRLAMLTKNAPLAMVLRALAVYVVEMLRFGGHEVARALPRGRRPALGLVVARLRSLAAFARWLPMLLTERRRIRGQRVVPDAAIVGWME